MPSPKVNYTELMLQVVRASKDPLPFNEIMARVNAIQPITSRNPKQTIRGALQQSRLVSATGDERYGWLPRLITGSVLRLTLSGSDLKEQAIPFGDEVRDALWPTFFENSKRRDLSPIRLRLPNGAQTELSLDSLPVAGWGTEGSTEFWAWLQSVRPEPGDHLIIQVLDGEAKSYGVSFEPHIARDEQAIAQRNHAIVEAALAYMRKRSGDVAIWEISRHLLATGQYKQATPPDPLSEIWTRDVWEPELKDASVPGGYLIMDPKLIGPILTITDLPDDSYDYENPKLPPDYDPDYGRRPRASWRGRRGPVQTYTLRVNHRALPKVWRDIEIAEDNTLEDLHLAIQRAFGWDDDHLYSFFMNGKAHDKRAEIGSPWSETHRHTHLERIGGLNLKVKDKFLYLFDYGDNHEFDVRVLKINPSAPKSDYPHGVGSRGKAPPQYPNYDEKTGEPEWDAHAHWRT